MRPDLQRQICERLEARRFHVNHSVLILQGAFSDDELAPRHHQPVPLVQVWRDNYIGNAGLILHGNKDETTRSTGTLAGNDTSCSAHEAAVGYVLQLVGREDAVAPQLMSSISH